MIELIVVCEGHTEALFVDSVLRPALANVRVRSQNLGGRLKFQRVKTDLRNTLRARTDTYVATFFDLYALEKDFPDFAAAKLIRDPLLRAKALEDALAAKIVAVAGCRPDRFVPHIQPYEFESLLFADIDQLIRVRAEWSAHAEPLHKARKGAHSPEHINDGPETHPSKRLAGLKPAYNKHLDGPAMAGAIGLAKLRQECKHFDRWVKRLEKLKPLK